MLTFQKIITLCRLNYTTTVSLLLVWKSDENKLSRTQARPGKTSVRFGIEPVGATYVINRVS